MEISIRTESSYRNQEILNSSMISKSTSSPQAWIPSLHHLSQSRFIYFVVFCCCYFVLFLLFWFDLLSARVMHVDHPVNKTAAWGTKSRLPSLAPASRQKLTSAPFWLSGQDSDREIPPAFLWTHYIEHLLFKLIPWTSDEKFGAEILLNS
jgi:hypothetical protein